jgi:hypothetical protein
MSYINTIYTVSLEFGRSPKEVWDHVIDLSNWWPEEFVGGPIQPGSEFVFRIGGSHYSKNRVVEFRPYEKVSWITLESRREGDDFDWSGTKMIFELTADRDGTVVKFTYDGVVLENEQERLAQICDWCIKEGLYKSITSFTATIEVKSTPANVFHCITAGVSKWWGGKDLTGSSTKLNDEFIINHPGTHYSKQKVAEVIPDKKIVWLITESSLPWLKDPGEWTNTKMIFVIIGKGDTTVLHFTHEGLTPDKECYARVSEGWSTVIKEWLRDFINEGKPHF